jgi:hypothetical protein
MVHFLGFTSFCTKCSVFYKKLLKITLYMVVLKIVVKFFKNLPIEFLQKSCFITLYVRV